MTQPILNNNLDTIEYSDNWLDDFEPYIYQDYDFRQEDRNGFLIQIPNFKTYEKREFESYLGGKIPGYAVEDSSSVWFNMSQIEKDQMWLDEYDLFKKTYVDKNSPANLWSKQAGKFLAFGLKKDGSGYEQLGSASSNAGALVSRIDKKYKLRLQIKDPVSGITFDNQEQFDKYKAEEEEKLTAKRYGDYYDTYSKYYKDGKIKDQDFGNALEIKRKWMDKYIQNNRPDNPYGNPVGTPTEQEQSIKQFKELKVIELLEYPERIGSLINWTFGNEENANPLEDGYPMTVHHPVKTEILELVLDEMVKHNKDKNPNVKAMIDIGRQYLKKNSHPTTQKIQQKLDDAKNESEDSNVIDFVFKDLLPTIMTGEYQGGNREARNRVWYGAKEVIQTLTHNKKGNRMQYSVNGRKTNEVRQAIDSNQEWLEAIISNPYAYENNFHSYAYKDLIMLPLFGDLVQEYKQEKNIHKQGYVPSDFMLWLYQHPDKKYSSTEDDGFYSYYELLKIGWNKNSDVIFDEMLNKVMKVDVDELGQYGTTKAVVSEYETYKRQRIHPLKTHPDYHGADLWEQMIHENPALLISMLQQSKKTRGDNFFPPDRNQGTWNENMENLVIRELREAFGSYDDNGEFIDWYKLKPFEFPTPGDIKESYVDSLYFNNPNYK